MGPRLSGSPRPLTSGRSAQAIILITWVPAPNILRSQTFTRCWTTGEPLLTIPHLLTADYLVFMTLTAPPVIPSLMTEEGDLGQISEPSEASLPLQIVR